MFRQLAKAGSFITLLGLTACSGVTSNSVTSAGAVATCGTAKFDSLPAILEPLATLAESDRITVTEALMASGAYEGRDWQIVSDDEDLVLFGSPTDSNFPYGHATFNRSDGAPTLKVANNCNLIFSAEGLNIASFRLDPEKMLDPASSSVPILFTEKACAGGGALSGRAVAPSVHETADRIEITVFIEAHEGPQTCPSNGEVGWVVELESPVGQRSIADASVIPSRDVG